VCSYGRLNAEEMRSDRDEASLVDLGKGFDYSSESGKLPLLGGCTEK
jgi:hypothetical protein